MPNKETWIRVHADLMTKLHLPCELRLTRDVKIGQHIVEDDGTCHIDINPDVDFRGPEHLILHEGAHCRSNADPDGLWHGHDEHWAKILCQMYREAGVTLPETTGFQAFAEAAGIIHRTEYHVNVSVEKPYTRPEWEQIRRLHVARFSPEK